MAALRSAGLWGLAGLLAACGDPQLGAQYRGVPRWSLQVLLQDASADNDPPAGMRMALFFSPGGLDVLDPERWVEHLGSAAPVQAPANVHLNVFDAPSPAHMLRRADGSEAGYAAGRLMAYVGRDGARRHTPGEPFVGIAPPNGFYYVPADLPAGSSPARGALAAGLHGVTVPQACGSRPPPPTDPGSCGVPLGERCDVDADCTGGLCLKETKTPWPAGYCVIPDPPPPERPCRPGAAAYMGRPLYSLTPRVAQRGLYLRACTTDDDCARPRDRDQGLYRCDPGLLACTPDAGMVVPTGGRFEIEPFCTRMP